jgi:hypothetical protein
VSTKPHSFDEKPLSFDRKPLLRTRAPLSQAFEPLLQTTGRRRLDKKTTDVNPVTLSSNTKALSIDRR